MMRASAADARTSAGEKYDFAVYSAHRAAPFGTAESGKRKREHRRIRFSALRFFLSSAENSLLTAGRSFLRRHCPYLFGHQLRDDRFDHRISTGPDLFLGQRHDRMQNGDHFIRRNAEVLALQTGRGDELRGRDVGGREALLFKVGDIVRTARDA